MEFLSLLSSSLWQTLICGSCAPAKGPPVQRKPLKNRDYEVDLSSRLGKTQVVLHRPWTSCCVMSL